MPPPNLPVPSYRRGHRLPKPFSITGFHGTSLNPSPVVADDLFTQLFDCLTVANRPRAIAYKQSTNRPLRPRGGRVAEGLSVCNRESCGLSTESNYHL
jgi:hypothetical protein